MDYEQLGSEVAALDRYIDSLGSAPFDDLGRNEKLALLINAYNAFTLKLILEHFPIDSIKDIPSADRWEARRWKVGGKTYSLEEIEHQQIRPKFKETRIHFALVCAAVGCPPLRKEAYTGSKLEEQLADQARKVHRDGSRWFQWVADGPAVKLTRLYQWFEGDFEQVHGSVLQAVATYSRETSDALKSGEPPDVEWFDYDWSLNDIGNAQ